MSAAGKLPKCRSPSAENHPQERSTATEQASSRERLGCPFRIGLATVRLPTFADGGLSRLSRAIAGRGECDARACRVKQPVVPFQALHNTGKQFPRAKP